MSEVFAIRAANQADAVACASILNEWIDNRDWMPRVHTPKEVEALYRDFILVKRHVWVNGDPVDGFLAFDVENAPVSAHYVAVSGRGVGKALLDHTRTGQDELELWTFVANTRARQFYVREGFAEIRETEGENEEGLPDVLLRWERVQ